MDDRAFPDGLFWISEDSSCICGNVLKKLHVALKSQDCGLVCQILESGVELCTTGPYNCFTHIVQNWKHPFLHAALKLQPSAVNCQGPRGNTLFMLCDTKEKMEIVLKFDPDVNAKNNFGDNVLHNATKKHLFKSFDTILNIAYQLISKSESIAINDNDVVQEIIDMLDVMKTFIELMKTIIKSGVDLDSLDSKGKTALQILLDCFKRGYVLTPLHAPSSYANQNLMHDPFLCQLSNELVSIPLEKLIKAEATLPPPDKYGRTALMLLAQSPWNSGSIELLIEQGVDVTAEDKKGCNAIYHLLKSFTVHCGFGCTTCIAQISYTVDEVISMLLDNGCPIQGTDLMMRHSLVDSEKVKTVLHLMALEDSKLNQREFPQKMNIKNDPRYISFLNLFLEYRDYIDHLGQRMCYFKTTDVALIEKEIASGLSTNQIFPCSDVYSVEDGWEEVPSLQHLSRTVLRSSFNLETTDTTGLDLSSLKRKTKELQAQSQNYVSFHRCQSCRKGGSNATRVKCNTGQMQQGSNAPRDKCNTGMTNPPYILEHLPEMAELLCHPRVYSFLHVPVQSGSDAVLADMKREYSRDDFEHVVTFLRERVPGINIATDIICGFPTETEADFAETLDLCSKFKFPSLFINQFFPRPGTPAELFLSYEPYAGREGDTLPVLVTEVSHDGEHYVGHTKNYEQVGTLWKMSVWRQNLTGK
ncbi:hypothetical protein B566_EDAN016381 [Ephemera danica]|nr:hypothetical protein B566_EDAN016381 [Ephemera danica]